MPIPAALLLGLYRSSYFGNHGLVVFNQRIKPLRFCWSNEDCLLEAEINRQLRDQPKRDLAGRWIEVDWSRRAGREQKDQGTVQIDCFLAQLRIGFSFVRQEVNLRLQERTIAIHLQYAKAIEAACNDVELSVFVSLNDLHDLRRAADLRDAIFDRPHNAKAAAVRQRLSDHLLVSRLKNVQRQDHAGK